MMKVAMNFPTIVELTDFELQLESTGYSIDKNNFAIMGDFTEREIELAMNTYQAKVVEILNTY